MRKLSLFGLLSQWLNRKPAPSNQQNCGNHNVTRISLIDITINKG